MKAMFISAMILLTLPTAFLSQEPAKPIQFEGQWETASAGTAGRIVLESEAAMARNVVRYHGGARKPRSRISWVIR